MADVAVVFVEASLPHSDKLHVVYCSASDTVRDVCRTLKGLGTFDSKLKASLEIHGRRVGGSKASRQMLFLQAAPEVSEMARNFQPVRVRLRLTATSSIACTKGRLSRPTTKRPTVAKKLFVAFNPEPLETASSAPIDPQEQFQMQKAAVFAFSDHLTVWDMKIAVFMAAQQAAQEHPDLAKHAAEVTQRARAALAEEEAQKTRETAADTNNTPRSAPPAIPAVSAASFGSAPKPPTIPGAAAAATTPTSPNPPIAPVAPVVPAILPVAVPTPVAPSVAPAAPVAPVAPVTLVAPVALVAPVTTAANDDAPLPAYQAPPVPLVVPSPLDPHDTDNGDAPSTPSHSDHSSSLTVSNLQAMHTAGSMDSSGWEGSSSSRSSSEAGDLFVVADNSSEDAAVAAVVAAVRAGDDGDTYFDSSDDEDNYDSTSPHLNSRMSIVNVSRQGMSPTMDLAALSSLPAQATLQDIQAAVKSQSPSVPIVETAKPLSRRGQKPPPPPPKSSTTTLITVKPKSSSIPTDSPQASKVATVAPLSTVSTTTTTTSSSSLSPTEIAPSTATTAPATTTPETALSTETKKAGRVPPPAPPRSATTNLRSRGSLSKLSSVPRATSSSSDSIAPDSTTSAAAPLFPATAAPITTTCGDNTIYNTITSNTVPESTTTTTTTAAPSSSATGINRITEEATEAQALVEAGVAAMKRTPTAPSVSSAAVAAHDTSARLLTLARWAPFSSPHAYTLTYTRDGVVYELCDEFQVLANVASLSQAMNEPPPPDSPYNCLHICISLRKKPERSAELTVQELLGKSTPMDLADVAAREEAKVAGRQFARVCSESVAQRDYMAYMTAPRLVPCAETPLLYSVDGRIQVRISHESSTRTLNFLPDDTAHTILASMLSRNDKEDVSVEAVASKYILQTLGAEDYLRGNTVKLREYACMRGIPPIHLKIVEISSLGYVDSGNIDKHLAGLADSCVNETRRHHELTSRARQLNSHNTISLWDITGDLRVFVKGADALRIKEPSSSNNSNSNNAAAAPANTASSSSSALSAGAASSSSSSSSAAPLSPLPVAASGAVAGASGSTGSGSGGNAAASAVTPLSALSSLSVASSIVPSVDAVAHNNRHSTAGNTGTPSSGSGSTAISTTITTTACFGRDTTSWVDLVVTHGGKPLCMTVCTRELACGPSGPRWNEWVTFTGLNVRDLPPASVLEMKVRVRRSRGRHAGPGDGLVTSLPLLDFRSRLRGGRITLDLYRSLDHERQVDEQKPLGTLSLTLENYLLPALHPCDADVAERDTPNRPLHESVSMRESFFALEELPQLRGGSSSFSNDEDTFSMLSQSLQTALTHARHANALAPVTEQDAALLWKYRRLCTTDAKALGRFLLSVPWGNRKKAREARHMLSQWAPIAPVMAASLLDRAHADPTVRAHAVMRLCRLSDSTLVSCLPQLVQALRNESHIDSPLARLLLQRGCLSTTFGHDLFWLLYQEIAGSGRPAMRALMMLRVFVRYCGAHQRTRLLHEYRGISAMRRAALGIKQCSKEERKAVLQRMLNLLPSSFPVPVAPYVSVGTVIAERCKFMDSKKLPLWLVFQNADVSAKGTVSLMFKQGDDIRQDVLTLQMISIMDRLWQEEGLDLRMTAYRCIATGIEEGCIEVVLRARTVASIQKAYGGKLGAFKDEPLRDWLKEQHPDPQAFDNAVRTFMLSCAGYCVATYVLGIGDRHNDNIMLAEDGRLLHIDFGHFLGNIKRKFKIKREGFTPFVLTPDFVFLMGGKTSAHFEEFVRLCCRAFLIVRRHADTFLSLFCMMVSTGIPELRTVNDIRYLRDSLCLDMTEDEAEAEMRRFINICLDRSWKTQVNWWIHTVAH